MASSRRRSCAGIIALTTIAATPTPSVPWRCSKGTNMIVMAASDLHNGQPETAWTHRPSYPHIDRFFDEVERTRPDAVVVTGDGLMEQTLVSDYDFALDRNASAVVYHARRLARRMGELGRPFILLLGNHDPDEATYRRFFLDAKVQETAFFDGVLYIHGHQFDLVERYLWDRLFGWAQPLLPRWLRLFQRRTPQEYLARGAEADYNRHVGLVHTNAMVEARKRGVNGLIMGHTHNASRHVDLPEGRPWVLDIGTLGFGAHTYARVINGHPELISLR